MQIPVLYKIIIASAIVLLTYFLLGKPIPFVHIFNPKGLLGVASDINGRIASEDADFRITK